MDFNQNTPLKNRRRKSINKHRRKSAFCFIYGIVLTCVSITVVNLYVQTSPFLSPMFHLSILHNNLNLKFQVRASNSSTEQQHTMVALRTGAGTRKTHVVVSEVLNGVQRHIVLIPLLVEHYNDGSLGNLLRQFMDPVLNQNLSIFVSISGISADLCRKVRNESIIRNVHNSIDVDLRCYKDKIYKGVNINLSVELLKRKLGHGYGSSLLTIMDADDLFFPCTLFDIVALYQHNPVKLIFHSFEESRRVYQDRIKDRSSNTCNPNSNPKVKFGGIELYDIARNSRWRPWILETAHHGHHTTELGVFDDVAYGKGKCCQDSKFVRDVINFYGRKPNTAIFSDSILTFYTGGSELWYTVPPALLPSSVVKPRYVTHTFMGSLGNEIYQYLAMLGLSKRLNRVLCNHQRKGFYDADIVENYHSSPHWISSVFETTRGTVIETPINCPDFQESNVPVFFEKHREFTDFKSKLDQSKSVGVSESQLIFIGGYLQHANYYNSYFNATSKLKIKESLLQLAKTTLEGCNLWVGLHHRVYPSTHNDVNLMFPDSYHHVLSDFFHAGYCLFVSSNKMNDIVKYKNVFSDKFDKIVFSESNFALDFTVLTQVDDLILSSGTFAYFAAQWNLYFNKNHRIFYHEDQKLLLGYAPVNKNLYNRVTWIPFSSKSQATQVSNLKEWDFVNDIVYVYSKVILKNIYYLFKSPNGISVLLNTLKGCGLTYDASILKASVVSLNDFKDFRNHFDLYRVSCPLTMPLVGFSHHSSDEEENHNNRDAGMDGGRVLCIAPLYSTQRANVSLKFRLYLNETIAYYINNLGFSRLEIPVFDVSPQVLYILQQSHYKPYVRLFNYSSSSTNGVITATTDALPSFGKGSNGLIYERGKLLSWNSCYLRNFMTATMLLFVDIDEILSVVNHNMFINMLSNSEKDIFSLESKTVVSYHKDFNEREDAKLSVLRFYDGIEKNPLSPYNAGRYHRGRWKYFVRGFLDGGKLLNDLLWTHSVSGLNYSYCDKTHHLVSTDIAYIRHYSTNFLFDGQIPLLDSLDYIADYVKVPLSMQMVQESKAVAAEVECKRYLNKFPPIVIGKMGKESPFFDVSFSWWDERRINLAKQDRVSPENFSIKLVRDGLRKLDPTSGSLFIDVGANVGFMSMLAVSLGFDTIAIDPMSYDISKICEGYKANQASSSSRDLDLRELGDLYVYHAALGSKPKDALEIKVASSFLDQTSLYHSVNKSAGDNFETVSMLTLDSLLNSSNLGKFSSRKVGFLKLDVQGWESEVFAGSLKLLSDPFRRPKFILYESTTCKSPDDTDCVTESNQNFNLISSFGYVCERYYEDIFCELKKKEQSKTIVYVLSLKKDKDRLDKFKQLYGSVFDVRVCYGKKDTALKIGYGNVEGFANCMNRAQKELKLVNQKVAYFFEDDAVPLNDLNDLNSGWSLPTVSDFPYDCLILLMGAWDFVGVRNTPLNEFSHYNSKFELKRITTKSYGSHAWSVLSSNLELLEKGFRGDLVGEPFRMDGNRKLVGGDISFYVNALKFGMSVYAVNPLLFGHGLSWSNTFNTQHKAELNALVTEVPSWKVNPAGRIPILEDVDPLPRLGLGLPNIVHYVFGLKEQTDAFLFSYYLSIYSVYVINRPRVIYFHYYYLPHGKWWDQILKDLGANFVLKKVNMPLTIGKKVIKKVAHKADKLRMDILYEHGGIYMDVDTISVRDYKHLLDKDVVLGFEQVKAKPETSICNAIMMTKPKSLFFKNWMDNYESEFDPDKWSEASILLPKKLWLENRSLAYVLGTSSFFSPNWYETEKIFSTPVSKIPTDLITLHLWETFSLKYLKTITGWDWAKQSMNKDTLYAKLMRNVEEEASKEEFYKLINNPNSEVCKNVYSMKGINSKEPIVKICLDNIKIPCNVLSFGIDHNFVFDDFMLSKGCRVWSFDPSMRGNYSRGKNHKFFSVGIGAKDEMTTDKSTFIERDDSREVTTFETKTLSTIMHEMNIDFVDIIRLDTEGAEWRFFDSWDFSKIGQLLLEVHMYFDLNMHIKQIQQVVKHDMTLFWSARNQFDSNVIYRDMTRVYEVGFVNSAASVKKQRYAKVYANYEPWNGGVYIVPNKTCRWISFYSHNYKMCVHEGIDTVSDEIARVGRWRDCDILSKLWKEIPSTLSGEYVEIGANIGACMMEMLVTTNDTKITVFEPNPLNLFCLTSTIANLPSYEQSRIIVYPYALGEKESTSTLYSHSTNKGNSIVGKNVDDGSDTKKGGIEEYTINIIRYDSVVTEKKKVKLMKLDAQGFECSIVRGMGKLVPKFIKTEIANKWLSAQNDCSDQVLFDLFHLNNLSIFLENGKSLSKPMETHGTEHYDIVARVA